MLPGWVSVLHGIKRRSLGAKDGTNFAFPFEFSRGILLDANWGETSGENESQILESRVAARSGLLRFARDKHV